jgi:glucokinase
MDVDRNYVVGLRLGATYVRSVLLNVKGEVVVNAQGPVDAEQETEVILGQLLGVTEEIFDKASITVDQVVGIGVAAPGAIDAEAGVCLYAPHHPKWKNVPLKQRFEKRFGLPCFVDHVNNCSALGERWFGVGRGVDNFLCILLGTGISAGIIIDGKVYRVVNCSSGEFGHVCIEPSGPPCACGLNGCLEAYASGPALARRAVEVLRNGGDGAILELAGGDIGQITAKTVYEAAANGDQIALEIFRDMGYHLGIGISTLINLFNPELIVLSGRVSRASRFFLDSLQETIQQRAWHISKKDIRISTLDRPAVLGAACVVLQEIYDSSLLFG